jgi:hypothetical protein
MTVEAERPGSEWTDEEIEALMEAEASDESTWPESLREVRERLSKICSRNTSANPSFEDWRREVVMDCVTRRTIDQYAVLKAALEALWARIPKGSPEHDLLNLIDFACTTWWADSIVACLDLAPHLDVLLPRAEPAVETLSIGRRRVGKFSRPGRRAAY